MALINCSECGKKYSDKAPACVSCGCPTSESVNKSIESEVESNIETNINSATLSERLKANLNAGNTNFTVKHYFYVLIVIVGGAALMYDYFSKPSYPSKQTQSSAKIKRLNNPWLESGALVSDHVTSNPTLINNSVTLIQKNGYRCDSVSSIMEMTFSAGLDVSCNGYRYSYEIKDVGGKWQVSVD